MDRPQPLVSSSDQPHDGGEPSPTLAAIIPASDGMADITSSLVLEVEAAPKIVTVTIEGIVEPEDLRRLLTSAPAPHGASVGDLKRVRERHHAVARNLANGMSQSLVAAITGFTPEYLTILLNNPSMQELVSHYRAAHTNAAEAIGDKLRAVSMDAIERLGERLETDELDDNALLALAKLGLDRSGHGPSSSHKVESTHHLVDHAELQRLNKAARAASRADIIEHRPAGLAAPAETAAADFGHSFDATPLQEPTKR